MAAMHEPEQRPASAIAPEPEATVAMDIVEIMSILPHRYPLLLIDRILEMEPRKRIVAIKNVTFNEPHFTGHFPDYPIMPGVLMVEAMAQAGGALMLTEISDRDERLMVFAGIENAKFRRPVVPGDQLRIEVSMLNWRKTAVKMLGVATVDGKVACEATLTCMVIPRPKKKVATPQPVAPVASAIVPMQPEGTKVPEPLPEVALA